MRERERVVKEKRENEEEAEEEEITTHILTFTLFVLSQSGTAICFVTVVCTVERERKGERKGWGRERAYEREIETDKKDGRNH